MKLEDGKSYSTRDGEHIITVEYRNAGWYPFVGQLDGFLETWTNEGIYQIDIECDWDLVSEYTNNEEEAP